MVSGAVEMRHSPANSRRPDKLATCPINVPTRSAPRIISEMRVNSNGYGFH
ncbi:hypothetical protein MAHJHV63_54460 [Mycobacterium avium subsp. hominissuis]|nr:hypothetical protein L839_3846 [Mycobacterium avium MAV_120809_2495]